MCVCACVYVPQNALCVAGVNIPGLRSESQGERRPVRYDRRARPNRKDKGKEGEDPGVREQTELEEEKQEVPEGEWTQVYTLKCVTATE